MNILVIGATRGVGLQVVKQAIERGSQVTALVRSPEVMPLHYENLKIVEGDARDADSVRSAMTGADIVISTIGRGPTRQPVDLFSSSTRAVLEAMADTGVDRLIAVTGIGAGDSSGHGGFFYDRILNPLLLGTIYADKNVEEELIRESSVDWIIVRPGFLTDGPLTRRYRIINDMTGVKSGKISRADVAHFILDQCESPTETRRTPLLTY